MTRQLRADRHIPNRAGKWTLRSFFVALFLVQLLLVHSIGQAAETIVHPGEDTLGAAVAAASDGDTLLLGDGAYGGVQVTIDKSLVIRATNRLTEAMVTSGINIDGAGIDVTIQGLSFTQPLQLYSAESIRILENTLTGADIVGQYYVGDGSVMIIGNTIIGGSIYSIRHDNAYIAGNIISNGYIWTESSAWIVGNLLFGGKHGTDGYNVIISKGVGATARILGNRVRCISPRVTLTKCIYTGSSVVQISANIIELEGLDNGTWSKNAISSNGTGFSTISNNVIRGINDSTVPFGYAIDARTPGSVIKSNIIFDYPRHDQLINASSPAAEVTHNLCFNNNQSCPAGEGNLTADPKFVDLVDYRLKPTSPAIDAGPPDYPLADLDRTRNDIGAYGGPWSIGQFDAPRAPGNLAPYVYPIFKIDNAYGGGDLELQAIGVARLR